MILARVESGGALTFFLVIVDIFCATPLEPPASSKNKNKTNNAMIWKRLFPTEGGGAVRRWVRVNKQLFDKARDSEHILKGPITLFDFSNPDDAVDALKASSGPTKGGWRVSDDEVIGGFSQGSMSLIATSEDFQRYKRGEEMLTSLEGVESADQVDTTTDNNDFTPFIRWKGTLDTSIGETSKVERSGFCAIRAPQFPFNGVNLSSKYNALEFTCRSDGRMYTACLTVSSFFPDDMYQGVIDIEPTHKPGVFVNKQTGGKFSRVIIPFRSFALTSAGREREIQPKLDGGVRLETIGITLMDGEDGDFEFDLARIRAVNYFDGLVLGEDDEDAPY